MTKSVTREVGIEGENSDGIIRIDSDRSGFREAQYGGRQATSDDREIRPRVASFVKSSVGISRMLI
jgi:hypothetical protein